MGIEDVVISAHLDQELIPLPEGWQYLGFIFARAQTAGRSGGGPARCPRAAPLRHRRLDQETTTVMTLSEIAESLQSALSLTVSPVAHRPHRFGPGWRPLLQRQGGRRLPLLAGSRHPDVRDRAS